MKDLYAEAKKVNDVLNEIAAMILIPPPNPSLHESWGGWAKFFRHLDHRKSTKHYHWFSTCNCHYFVIRTEPYRGCILDPMGYLAYNVAALNRRGLTRLMETLHREIAELRALAVSRPTDYSTLLDKMRRKSK